MIRNDLPHRVVLTRARTPVIVEVLLHPLEDHVDYQPGQYVLINDVDFRVPPRSYSIANAPRHDGLISILVTRVAGGVTSEWIHQLGVGDTVAVSGGYGALVAERDSDAMVLYLAAGSGLAPIRALAEAALIQERLHRAILIMSARTEDDVIDAARFLAWERRFPGFRFLRTLTGAAGPAPGGRLPTQLVSMVPDIHGREVFIAGAPGFVRACAAVARDHGVRGTRLHTEEFFDEPQPWTTTPTAAHDRGGDDR